MIVTTTNQYGLAKNSNFVKVIIVLKFVNLSQLSF